MQLLSFYLNFSVALLFPANMQKLIFIIFAFSALAARSQAPGRMVQFSPPPVHNNSYLNADLPVVQDKYPIFSSGSPYFLDEWLNADIELANGAVDKNVKVRLDLIENTLQYISPEGRELIATAAIKTVILKDSSAGNVYKFVPSSFLDPMKNAKVDWYLELVSGPACLYKWITKAINQPKNYIPSESQASVISSEEFLIYADSILLPVKRIKDVPHLLNNKVSQLDAYITTNKLSGKSESGFIELIRYYNGLLNPVK
jgi:hypothetical protein